MRESKDQYTEEFTGYVLRVLSEVMPLQSTPTEYREEREAEVQKQKLYEWLTIASIVALYLALLWFAYVASSLS